jgi:hypothetical protein
MRRGRKLSVVAVVAAGVVVAAVVMAAVAAAMVVAAAVAAAAVDVAEIVEIAETAGKKGLPNKSGVPTTTPIVLEIFLKYPERELCACQPLGPMQHLRWKSVYTR